MIGQKLGRGNAIPQETEGKNRKICGALLNGLFSLSLSWSASKEWRRCVLLARQTNVDIKRIVQLLNIKVLTVDNSHLA